MRRGRAGYDQQQVLDQAAESAEQVDGLLLAVGSGAVTFSGVEELRIIRLAKGGVKQNQRVLAGWQGRRRDPC